MVLWMNGKQRKEQLFEKIFSGRMLPQIRYCKIKGGIQQKYQDQKLLLRSLVKLVKHLHFERHTEFLKSYQER